MASVTDAIAPCTWVAIDIAKGVNVALVEHADGRQQRFRFTHERGDCDRLVEFLRACLQPWRVALEPTADYHRTPNAGSDPEAAVVPAEVAALMIDYDRRVRHFEVIA